MFQAQGSVSGMASSNISPPGLEAKEDYSLILSPRGILVFEAPSFTTQLAYNFIASYYYYYPEAQTFNHLAEWLNQMYLSEETTLLLGANFSQGQIRTLFLGQGAGTSTLALLPEGDVDYLTLSVTERLDFHPSGRWTYYQTLQPQYFYPYHANPIRNDNITLLATFGADYHFPLDTLGYLLELTWLDDFMNFSTLGTSFSVRWLHDINEFWSTEARGGLTLITPLNEPSSRSLQPNLLGAIHYNGEIAWSTLQGTMSSNFNPLVGTVSMADEVRLSAGLPIGEERRLQISGSVGYQYAHVLFAPEGQTDARTRVFLADAAIDWRMVDWLWLGARYQYFYQEQWDTPTPRPDYVRHVGIITLTIALPPDPVTVFRPRDLNRADNNERDNREFAGHAEGQQGQRRQRSIYAVPAGH